MSASDAHEVRMIIARASGLYKSDIFSSPYPFATVTINNQEVLQTKVCEKTTSPCWGGIIVWKANADDIIAIRVFDKRRYHRKEQGFLGVAKFRLDAFIPFNTTCVDQPKTFTQNLQIPKGGSLVTHGNVTFSISIKRNSDTERFWSEYTERKKPKPPPYLARSIPQEEQTPQQNSVGTAPLASRNIENLNNANVTLPIEGASSVHSFRTIVTPESATQQIIPPEPSENQPFTIDTTSEEAIALWKQKFVKSQVHFEKEESPPFTTLRRLGGGGVGIVWETTLDGIFLALKRTYTRRLTSRHLNEFEILTRITERRHKHIVKLVGSYIHKQSGAYELGLLIWPVARCDLAEFLQDLDSIGEWIQRQSMTDGAVGHEDLDSSIVETLSAISGISRSNTKEHPLAKYAIQLHESSLGILHSRFGCIAKAVAWLHQQGIRHKDLKPSQVLLSPDGLWLTDFGWSKDISEMAQSTTSDGDNITLKYQSPERAKKEACGRPEDIFALGCIFLEMAYQLAKPTLASKDHSAPWLHHGWYFQTNLSQVKEILKLLKHSMYESGHGFVLIKIIADMLAKNPDERPSITEVLGRLSSGSYFSECCMPVLEDNLSNSPLNEQSQPTAIYQNPSIIHNNPGIPYQSSQYPMPTSVTHEYSPIVPMVHQRSLYSSPITLNPSTNAFGSAQINQQQRSAQQDFQIPATTANTLPESTPSSRVDDSFMYQDHPPANTYQTFHNIGGTSLGFHNHIPPTSTNTAGHPSAPAANHASIFSPPNQFSYPAPQPPNQSSNQPPANSFSNLSLSNTAAPQPFICWQNPDYPNQFHRTDSYDAQIEPSFGPPPPGPEGGSRMGLRQMKKALTQVDRQLNGLINDDRTGHGLLNSSPTGLHGVARGFGAKRGT